MCTISCWYLAFVRVPVTAAASLTDCKLNFCYLQNREGIHGVTSNYTLFGLRTVLVSLYNNIIMIIVPLISRGYVSGSGH